MKFPDRWEKVCKFFSSSWGERSHKDGNLIFSMIVYFWSLVMIFEIFCWISNCLAYFWIFKGENEVILKYCCEFRLICKNHSLFQRYWGFSPHFFAQSLELYLWALGTMKTFQSLCFFQNKHLKMAKKLLFYFFETKYWIVKLLSQILVDKAKILLVIFVTLQNKVWGSDSQFPHACGVKNSLVCL